MNGPAFNPQAGGGEMGDAQTMAAVKAVRDSSLHLLELSVELLGEELYSAWNNLG